MLLNRKRKGTNEDRQIHEFEEFHCLNLELWNSSFSKLHNSIFDLIFYWNKKHIKYMKKGREKEREENRCFRHQSIYDWALCALSFVSVYPRRAFRPRAVTHTQFFNAFERSSSCPIVVCLLYYQSYHITFPFPKQYSLTPPKTFISSTSRKFWKWRILGIHQRYSHYISAHKIDIDRLILQMGMRKDMSE